MKTIPFHIALSHKSMSMILEKNIYKNQWDFGISELKEKAIDIIGVLLSILSPPILYFISRNIYISIIPIILIIIITIFF